ncbi:MAG: histidine kinase, partial [Chitinophagaceae bacterium]
MKSSFKGNLLLSFGLSLLLLVISSVASYVSITRLLESREEVEKTNTIIRDLENVISTMKDAETGQRGFLLTKDERFLAPYNGSYATAMGLQVKIKAALRDRTQLANVDSLKRMIGSRLNALELLIQMKRQNFEITNNDLERGKQHMDEIRLMVKTMEEFERIQLDKKNAELTKLSTYTPNLILIAALLSIIITILSFVRVNT